MTRELQLTQVTQLGATLPDLGQKNAWRSKLQEPYCSYDWRHSPSEYDANARTPRETVGVCSTGQGILPLFGVDA